MYETMTIKDYGSMLFKMAALTSTIFPMYNGEIYRILTKLDEDAKMANHADTLGYMDMDDLIELANNLLDVHKNPPGSNLVHGETKSTIGLDVVRNLKLANYQEAILGESNDLYMTPYMAMESLRINGLVPLHDHVNDKDNPHEITAEQLDTLIRSEVDSIVSSKYYKDETVAGANLGELNGKKNYTQLLDHFRTKLPAANFTLGTVPPTAAAAGTPGPGTVINPAMNRWEGIGNYLSNSGIGAIVTTASFNSSHSPSTAFNFIKSNSPYKDLPPNSVVFFKTIRRGVTDYHMSGGNGSSWHYSRHTDYWSTSIAVKTTNSSWVLR